ncbi:hypothetical protein AB2P52_18940, partial [Acinetobacter baumannii]
LEPSPPPARPRREGAPGGNGGRDGSSFQGEHNFKIHQSGRVEHQNTRFDDNTIVDRSYLCEIEGLEPSPPPARPRREGGFEDRPRRSFGGEDRPRREKISFLFFKYEAGHNNEQKYISVVPA